MAALLEREIHDLESRLKKFPKGHYCREQYEVMSEEDRKKELLTDIRVRCLNTISDNAQREGMKLAACWKQIQEGIKWLSYEKYIDDQPEIDEIHNICEALIRDGRLDQEEWEIRKKVLTDIIQNKYYDYYSCGDVMAELAGKLCTNKEEYLACAEIMESSGNYEEEAAHLYYQYGRDDKYVSYLESHLDRRCKEYSELITYYQNHNQCEDARRVAELGLESCREDLTDIFICLLTNAQKDSDEKRFKKLYASAKRRKHVDIEKIKKALEDMKCN